jgi:hypothetical protein
VSLNFRKGLSVKLAYFIAAIFIIGLAIPLFASVHLSLGQEGNYTYYGVVPSKIWRYLLNDWNAQPSWNNLSVGWSIGLASTTYISGAVGLNGELVATKALLAIVAAEDDTNVKVYDLTLGALLDEGNINSMERHYVLLANGTQFKVVSNKIVTVELLNYQQLPTASSTEGPVLCTFYTDVNGLYVGKEFVLIASERADRDYMIFALEPSTVTVTRDDGTVTTYTLEVNSYIYITLPAFRIHRIESTGNIMVQSGQIPGKGTGDTQCFAVPSAEGGFVGTTFYTRSLKNQEWGWDPLRDYGFQICALEDTHVTVYDLETQQVLMEFTVTGGGCTAIQVEARAIGVQSDNPITLSFIHNGGINQGPTGGGVRYASYANGVIFIGIRANEDTMVHLPTNASLEAYFFASAETQLTIDVLPLTIHANMPYEYTMPGTHVVRADHDVILQINLWPNIPENQGLWYRGAVIPCIEKVSSNPEVTLTPFGGGFPMMYIMIGAAVAAVVVIAGFLGMRRRGGKPS